MGLFAGGLTTLDSRIGDNFNGYDSPASWKALRFFLYSAIMLNLSGSFLALMIIKICIDMQLTAYEQNLPPSPYVKSTVTDLLSKYGMSPWYWLVNRSFVFISLLAWVCTFLTLSFWVLLSETLVLAVVTMVLFGLVAFVVLCVFAVTIKAERWT
jgi:hypothetical protein